MRDQGSSWGQRYLAKSPSRAYYVTPEPSAVAVLAYIWPKCVHIIYASYVQIIYATPKKSVKLKTWTWNLMKIILYWKIMQKEHSQKHQKRGRFLDMYFWKTNGKWYLLSQSYGHAGDFAGCVNTHYQPLTRPWQFLIWTSVNES